MFKEYFKEYIDRFLTWLSPLKKEPCGLLEAVNSARREWQLAKYDFDFVSDQNFIDCTIHKIKASERQYMAMLKLAKQDKITAWQLEPPSGAATGKTLPAGEETSQTTRAAVKGPGDSMYN
ncbi:hypothetical protein SPSYN_00860 [Sporotomaculum syntrophicum]|uniref:DUF2508 family protein n=1 Tax=Sporotomaculum syntrophicum TaxID=182264 RepID=A0A9D2WSJ3_9FIRM|nr:DUF2508 family protein [Sporotomaculum syntrophicum]KAF1086121.1 hypothetical protein SPSYN_00860 [Sporotomaculum syntrophicum]